MNIVKLIICCILTIGGMAGYAGAVDNKASVTAEKSEYTLTIIPYYSPEKLWAKFTPLVEYLRKTTNKPWELKRLF